MNALETVLEDTNIAIFNNLSENVKNIETIYKKFDKYVEKLNLTLKLYQETGDDPGIILDNWETSDEETEPNNHNSNGQVSFKENIDPEVKAKANKLSLEETPPKPLQPPPEDEQEKNSVRETRSKRNAFKQATTNIQEQSTKKLNTKQRRPTTTSKTPRNVDTALQNTDNCYVKVEKLSLGNDAATMPVPTRPAPKKRTRKKKAQQELKIKQENLEKELSSAQIKQEKLDEDLSTKMNFTDVVVHEQTLTVITLDDSSELLPVSDEKKEIAESIDEETTKETVVRKTRTKRNRAKIADDEDAEANERDKKRSKSSEDGDDTLTKRPDTPMMDSTIVVYQPKYVKNVDDMTVCSKQEETKSKHNLSPFETSPVKKKVEAFERLNEESAYAGRAKTRSQTQDNLAGTGAKKRVKEMVKSCTPLQSKFIPKDTSTGIKPHFANSVINDSSSVTLSSSVLRAPREDYRERERKRIEKEENLRKREALIQAQMEEKRRKRQERQLKAQQTREALEKEKLKALDLQKLKEERHRQLVVEQEQRKKQMKEEAERKRLQAKLRAKVMNEEQQLKGLTQKMARRGEEMKMSDAQKTISTPIYMKTKPPRLPTQDCYDSDEEGYDEAKGEEPAWTTSRNLHATQRTILAAGEAVKNTFFSVQAQSADLQEIFEVIKPNKLKRTSSAVWAKPPRFTMIPGLEQHEEAWEDYY